MIRPAVLQPRLRWLLWLAGFLLLVGVVQSVPLAGLWAAFSRLGVGPVLALVVANGLVLLSLTGRWWLILRAWGYAINYITLAGYRLAAFGVSYFTPGPQFGGEPLQVYLTRRHHGLPYDRAVAAVTLDKLLELLVNFSFLVLGVWLVGRQGFFSAAVNRSLVLFAAGLLVLPAAVLLALAAGQHPLSGMLWLARPLVAPLDNRLPGATWSRRYGRVMEVTRASEVLVTDFYGRYPGWLLMALLASGLSWILLLGEYWLMLWLLGAGLNLGQAMIALTVARLAILLPLPGGLGVLEASQVLALGMLGVDPATALSVALLIRARDVLLGGLGLWWGGVKS
jgi:uncharacterized membrane protein YbhN (UPF0104 family)